MNAVNDAVKLNAVNDLKVKALFTIYRLEDSGFLHLLQEGKKADHIFVTGNTAIDALYMVVERIKKKPELNKELAQNLLKAGYNVKRNKKMVLITGHRRENFGEGFTWDNPD
ncbi:MAG: hypothetical protein EOM64_01660, partial [Erysipelotrichia bacterium]|nr:hypothetical protein [Erysipelotrichia bacterium]